jgi:release factor glutamine methyltransferase
MRIGSNQLKSVMDFSLAELKHLYPTEEIKSILYYLFQEYLHVSRTDYILNPQRGMSESELLKFNFAIKDLKKGKPLQHILGYTYFLNHKFYVNSSTLIPRSETEELVSHIINKEAKHQNLSILDIGTGTACIPICLAKEMPQHQYTAIDIHQDILNLASKNAELHQVEINFHILDILHTSVDELKFYDIIISNPPYVLESEKKQMHKNILDYEPASALYVADDDALVFYKKIGFLASKRLKPEGRLYFEINENKAREIVDLLQSFNFHQIQIIRDMHGKDRFIEAILIKQ